MSRAKWLRGPLDGFPLLHIDNFSIALYISTPCTREALSPYKDQTITVSELQACVIEQIRNLTQGGQNPTVRRENLEYDFVLY